MLRSFHHRDFPPARLVEAKRGRRISVCLPARDEAATVGQVVTAIRLELMERVPLVDELIVIDDGSTDATAATARAAGADVVSAADVSPDAGAAGAAGAGGGGGAAGAAGPGGGGAAGPGGGGGAAVAGAGGAAGAAGAAGAGAGGAVAGGAAGGKGQAMWKALYMTTGDLVVFCDADIRGFGWHFITGLLGPLLLRDDVVFVKGFYDRPLEGRPHEGGRVTELVARPLISALFPHLATVIQPLAGECAAPRPVLEQIPFVDGYGVDLGLVIDIAARWGVAAMAQCDLGERIHRNRPLADLGPQALAIVQVALSRAGLAPDGCMVPWQSRLVRPGVEPVAITLSERRALSALAAHVVAEAERRTA